MKFMKFAPNLIRIAERTAFAVLTAYGLYTAFFFFHDAYFKIFFPYMTNLGEPSMAQAIMTFQKGIWPYHDLRNPPYCLVPYGPVYLWLGAASYHFFQGPFAGPRFVAFAATALTALLIFLILRKNAVKPLPALVSALFFLSHPYVQRWNAQVNVDMTGVFFSAAAFYFLFCFSSENFRPKIFLIAGILMNVAAFFTKSSMVACPAVFFVYLLFRRRFKLALGFWVAQALPIGLIYLWLNHATEGQYFFHTTYEISKRLYFWQFLYRFWIDASIATTLPVLVTLFFLIFEGFRKKIDLIYIYVLFSVLMTVSLGKQGSDTNYLLEWCVTSSLALGILLRDFSGSAARGILWILMLIQMFHWGGVKSLDTAHQWNEERKAFYENVSLLIRKTPGKILSEDMGILIANGREIFYEPFPMGQMSYSGAWDERIILDILNRREFSLAILYFYAPVLRQSRTFTQNFLDTFVKNYRFIGRTEIPGTGGQQLFFYAPKK